MVTKPIGRLAIIIMVTVAAIVTALIIKDWGVLNVFEEPSGNYA